MTAETRTLIDAAVEHLPRVETTNLAPLGLPRSLLICTPDGSSARIEDLEKYADAPSRVRQNVSFETPNSFVQYVKAFTQPGATRVFAHLGADRKVVALIDYHGEGAAATASWVSHKAVYPAVFSPAFAAWAEVHDTMIPQKEFADFLEDRAEDAVQPSPADLMEVALKFEAVRDVEFQSAVNLASGERQFKYQEKDSVAGAIAIPKALVLRTPIFYGTDPVEWRVSFGYRLGKDGLAFRVKIHRFKEILDMEFGRLTDAIAVDLPGIPVHRGKTTA